MIYTVTLNPALDEIFETKGFTVGQTNYYQQQYQLIGGKGINVAIVLNNLKTNVLATGILGSQNDKFFRQKFDENKLKHNFFLNNGNSRINLKIKNLTNNEETEINGIGTLVKPAVITELKQFLHHVLQPNDILVVAGSIPPGVKNNIYYELGMIAKAKQALFILDAANKSMLSGLKAKPFLIKPNLAELCQILNYGYKAYNFKQTTLMVAKVKKLGAQNVLLSLGSKGSYYFNDKSEIYQIKPVKGKLVNSVGAGDSMVAGMIYGLDNNLSLEETLRYSTAAACATVFSQWLAKKAEIEILLPRIKVIKIK